MGDEVEKLRAELRETKEELAASNRAVHALSTGRRVLVQEVRELRALVAGHGGQVCSHPLEQSRTARVTRTTHPHCVAAAL